MNQFWTNVTITGFCWTWNRPNKAGYGYCYDKRSKSMIPAHRWSYETLVGSIPTGLQLDHLCRNRACVNPDHLEPVTQQENLVRSPLIGKATGAKNKAKEQCPRGHAYAGNNLRVTQDSKRLCRACQREAQRSRREHQPFDPARAGFFYREYMEVM